MASPFSTSTIVISSMLPPDRVRGPLRGFRSAGVEGRVFRLRRSRAMLGSQADRDRGVSQRSQDFEDTID